MPIVTVEMMEGRTPEQKKKLVQGITSAFVDIGTPAEVVQVILKDNSRCNWAVAGKLVAED